MTSRLEFETPENIRVAYEPAGLGTRYMAWILDSIILSGLIAVTFILAVVFGVMTDTTFREAARAIEGLDGSSKSEPGAESLRFLEYFIGLAILVWGLGSFAYFACSELWLRGQSLGKRAMGLRVVRIDGFSLDPSGVFVRNIFRVIDQLPPVWLVPLLSKRSQRLGDMVAGTTVIVDRPQKLSQVRQLLADAPVADAQFTFDVPTLKRARSQDFEAIEKILERWSALTVSQQDALLNQLMPSLVERLKTDPPLPAERVVYLQDLLAAEYRRQHRNL